MRYYKIHYPGQEEPDVALNVRRLRNLPEGTTITAILTERDGGLSDAYDIPVVNGRAQIQGRGKARVWKGGV